MKATRATEAAWEGSVWGVTISFAVATAGALLLNNGLLRAGVMGMAGALMAAVAGFAPTWRREG